MEGILRFFTKDKLIVNLIIIVVAMYGVASLRNIRQEHMPPVDIDKMIIVAFYPGASAADVELNALIPIEDVLREISGIEEFHGVAMEDMAQLLVSIDQDVRDKQGVKDQVFRSVSKSTIPDLPDEVEDIRIVDINPRERPVYKLHLSINEESGRGLRDLYDMADTLEGLLRRVPGVSSVDKQAYREREVHVDVIPGMLDRYNISLFDITRSIESRNVRATGGTLHSTQREKTVVTLGQFDDPMEVGEVVIRSGFEQERIRVKDVAKIRDDFDRETIRAMVNGRPGVLLSIKKKENADVITTVRNIQDFLEKHESLYGGDFSLNLVEDNSETISSLLKVVRSNALIGFVLVVLVLFIFLDLKTSLWTAFGIPFSMLVVVSVMYVMDISFNVLTIGAVITVLGMMVDDAIVVAENIYDKKQSGMPAGEAVVQGTKEVIAPVTITILSTIVAFMPMITIGGVMGKFVYFFPIVIALTLLASLAESTLILPSHLNFDRGTKREKKHWFTRYMDLYAVSLKKVLKFRYLMALGFVLLLILSVFMSRDAIRGFVLFWDDTSEVITVNLIAPPGTPLAATERLTREVSDAARKIVPDGELVSTYILTGKHGGRGFHAETRDHWSSLQIKLVPKTEREKTAEEYAVELRGAVNLKKFPEFEQIVVQAEKPGPVSGAPVDIKVISSDGEDSREVAEGIKEYLQSLPGVKNVDDDRKKGIMEIAVQFDYDRLAQYGMNVKTVAATVRTAFEGQIASYVQTPKHRIEFRVQVDPKYTISETFLKNLLVPNATGRLVRLDDIADFSYRQGQSSIKHYNGDRAISVTAEVNPEVTTSRLVNRAVEEKFSDVSSRYSGLYLLYAGEAEQTAETMGDIYVAFALALAMIYFIILLLFRSVMQPFVVLSVIPFGLIGVLLALAAHGIPLSFMAFIGVIGLSGVVVNDSVIMVDYINTVVRSEKDAAIKDNTEELFEKIARGARQRFRPIILTTITTVAGLMPTVYGVGGEAKMMVPTVMAMAYGLIFATVLTLYFLPSLYMMQLDAKRLFARLFGTNKKSGNR